MNKKVLFISCLIIFISSVACVSASEDFNQANMEDTGNANGDMLSISPGENEIVGADTGTFTQLQEMINGTQAGSSVNLNTDYEYDSEFSNAGIIIDKPLTINGNGKALDAKGASRIFQITATGNVILNNITFKNGYFNGNGGAIYVPGDLTDSTFENLKFVNNTADNNGGALYFYGQSSGILFDNVTFENNVAQCADSGAVNFRGKMTNVTFNDVTFYNNSAKRMGDPTSHSMGGAVNIDNGVENCLFNNTLFMENTAKNSAGALSVNGKISALAFENTRFINNTAELEDGGAIHIGPWKVSNLAGATFKNVTFDGNNANKNGGALYVTGETSSNIFEDVKFINNTAKTANGGAICLGSKNTFNAVKNTFENVTFADNTANSNGGALYIKGASSSNKFIKVNFTNNVAQCGDSGAVNFYAKISDTIFDNVIFYNNSAKRMGAPTSHSMGGAVNIDNGVENCLFNNTSFIQNTAKNSAGALSVNGKISALAFENTRFINNTAELEDGGAIHIGPWKESNLAGTTFKNVTFDGNNANNNGGALYVTGETSSNIFEDVKFINNTAKTANGGAIFLSAKDNLNTVNNTFENVTFADNTANSNGGALYIKGASSSNSFEKAVFINNTGQNVVYIKQSDSNNTISDSIFINNDANKIVVKSGTVQMTDDWFGNNATNYNELPDAEIVLDNWLFLNATANPNAIAINQTSTVNFKLLSYNKGNVEEYDGPMSILLGLSSTLGSLDQNYTLIDEDIVYTASERGYGSVTGKFENVYYTIVLKNKESTEINVTNSTLELEIDTEISTGATLIPAEAGDLNYTSSNESVAVVDNGQIIALDEGTATITVSFEGNDDYAPAENKTIFVTVKDSYRNITAEELTKLYGNPKPFVVNVTNSRGKAVAGETVLITVNGVTYNKTTDENGTVSLNINLASGDYPVNITVGNYSADSYVHVMPTILGEDVESEFRNVTYVVYVLDSEGRFLENGTAVECNINGVIYTVYVGGDDGEAAADLILNSGNYTITATNPVTNEKTSNNITVNAINPSIDAVADEIVEGENATVYVTLPENASGTVTIGNEAVTVVDGTASAVLTNLPVGNNNVSVIYEGDYRYNPAETEVIVTVNPKTNAVINVKSEYAGTVYAGVYNNIDVTVENTGVSANNVTVTLKMGDEVIDAKTLTDYESGETYTLSFIDPTIRPITENTVLGNDNEYMNYTVVVEYADGTVINETNSEFVILYDGNLGKDYEYPGADPLLREYNITGDVIISQGSQYAGSSDNVSDVINAEFDGDVAEALLYVAYNWNNPDLGDFTTWNITFNDNVIAPIASYKDQGNLGKYGAYAYGLVVYNVTDFVISGNNTLSISKTAKSVAIYPATLMVLTNNESSHVAKTVYILEEVDLLSKTYNKDLAAGFTTNFDVIDGNATFMAFAASAQKGEGNLVINGQNYTDVWNGTSQSVEMFSTDVDAGVINVIFESSGATILALNQMVIVENIIKQDLTLNATIFDLFGNASLIVTGFENATGNVTITIGEDIYTSSIMMGMAFISIPKFNETVTAYIYYPGDDNYNNASTSVDIIPKKNLNLTASADPIYVGQNATLIVTGFENATGNVMVIAGRGFYNVTIVDGIVTVTISGLNNTTAAYVIYMGDGNYSMAYTGVNITVNPKENATIVIDAPEITVGENATVTVTLPEDATGTVTIGNEAVPVVNGTASAVLTNLPLGNTTVPVTYSGDDKYNPIETEVNITVNPKGKENATISIDVPSEVSEGDNVTVSVTLPEDATGTVTIGNEVVPVQNGTASAVLTDVPAGNTTVPVTYSGDDKYNPIETEVNITVNPKGKENATISIDVPSEVSEGDNVTVSVTLPEDATGTVTIGNEVVPVVNGTASAVLTNLPAGNVTVPVTYSGDDKYNPIETEVNITVNPKGKENATISIDVPSEVSEGDNVTVTVTLPEDATGTVTIGNEAVPVVNGTASAILTNLPQGNTTVPITYSGDDKYNPIETEVNITVKEDTSDIISAPDVTKYYGGSERFVVTVTDNKGNPLANKTVIININGRNYTRTTDENGTASMAIGLPTNAYNVTVTVDNQTVNAVVTILSTVNGTDVVKMYRNGTQYYATFLDTEGKYLADGTVVNFNINGVFYERKVSGDKGLARLNINLPEGEYIITAMNPTTGEMAANNITVLPTIVENKDITKYYKNGTQYTVKVLGADGKPVGAGETVRFNINGVFYERQTNESGIAKLTINLPPGDYVITAEYNGYKVSNNIKVLPILTAKDIKMKYRDGTKFVATLVDGQGKPYVGQSVRFNINGVFYNRATDTAGQAKLNINLLAGEYIITSSYNGANIANKITITA